MYRQKHDNSSLRNILYLAENLHVTNVLTSTVSLDKNGSIVEIENLTIA